MGGFMGWFLTFVLVVAIFNAEKLPALRAMLEEKFKNSVDAAKEGSKLAKDKIKQVKKDIENKKTESTETAEAEENTPEEIAAELKVMSKYVPSEESDKSVEDETKENSASEETSAENKDDNASAQEEQPIDLENRY